MPQQTYRDAPLSETQQKSFRDAPLQPSPAAPQRPAEHPHARVARGVMDLARGVKAGALSTVFHGGDVVRRLVGADRVLDRPDVQQLITPPENLPGKIGFLGEQAAEFAVPLSRLAGLTKGAGLGTRMAADAVSSAAVAGVQSGADPTAMSVGAVAGAALPVVAGASRAIGGRVRAAAAGARADGVGGALAGAVRSVAPSSSKAMLVQGLKPSNTRVRFDQSLDLAMPELKATEAALGKPIESIDDLIAASKTAKHKLMAQYSEMSGQKQAMGLLVDGNPIADEMVASIPAKVRLENPTQAEKLIAQADTYRRQFPLGDLEQLLVETNAQLDGFYGKFPFAQRKALAANPKVARLEAQARSLRDAIYTSLDAEGGGTAARELKRRYGALMEVEQTALRRANVAKRQQPESLSEQIGSVRAAADLARGTYKVLSGDPRGAADIMAAHAGRSMARSLKEQQSTDALIRRAFQQFEGTPTEIVMPVARPVRGLLGKAPFEAGPVPDTSGPIAPTLPENYVRERALFDELGINPGAPVVSSADEKTFLVRWLADDLREMPYQPSARMRGVHALDVMGEATSQEAGRQAVYAPRVAGTPTLDMFHAMGFKGSRSEIANKLDRYLRVGKGSPKLEALADAMREAWDGQNFDWDLVSDQTITKLGVRRRDLRSPISLPTASDQPEIFRRFFPEGGES